MSTDVGVPAPIQPPRNRGEVMAKRSKEMFSNLLVIRFFIDTFPFSTFNSLQREQRKSVFLPG
jgi:hypothetical protein